MLAFRWTDSEGTYGAWQTFWIVVGATAVLLTGILVIWWDFRARAARRADRRLEESDWWQGVKNRLDHQLQDGEIPCPYCQRALNPTTDRVTDTAESAGGGSGRILLRCLWCRTVTEYPGELNRPPI